MLMVSILAAILVAGSIHYGIMTQHAAVENSKTIFMSANETYNTSSKPQNLLLQSVCMQVLGCDSVAANSKWSLTKGSCVPATTEPHSVTFCGNATRNVSYLVNLLVDSKITMNVTNNANVKIYRANVS